MNSVSSSLQSGFARRLPQNEVPVFIICREALNTLSARILEDAQTTTLAPVGHKSHGALFHHYPHVSSLSKDDIAQLRFAEAQNVLA
jgi:hypothetical protein